MNDIGSRDYNPQTQHIPRPQPVQQVAVHRAERSLERDTVTVAKASTVQSHRTVEQRGSEEPVLDSKHQLLYMRPAARINHSADDVAHTVSYTQQAGRVTTATCDESRSLLDMQA